jgi:phosphoserine phosphatase
VRPNRTEVAELARQYVENIAANAKETLARLRARGVEVVLVSGGLREAILPLATEIGLKEDAVNAVPIFFNARGEYTGFDKDSALARQNGKRETVSRLNLPQRILAVGDGMTDTEMRACADTFAAYTGFVRREAVVAKADLVIEDFRQLEDTVLG